MTRSAFTCARCTTVLAVIQPATVLRITPGVAVSFNWRYGTIRLSCPCGHLEAFDVKRRVEVVEVGEAAA